MMKRIAVMLLLLVGASACSGGTNGDEWASLRGELVVQGISSESTRCVIGELESVGVQPQDLTTAAEPATIAAGQEAYDVASKQCFTNAEVDAIIEREIEELLPDIANGLGISIAETRCIVAGFESQGLSFADVASGDGGPAVADAMAVLLPACTEDETQATAPAPAPGQTSTLDPATSDTTTDPATTDAATSDPATTDPATTDPADDVASIYNTPEFRQLLIDGIATGTGQPPEVATCILDETLAQGLTIEDFVIRGGDEVVTAAITEASIGCIPG